MGAEFFCAWTEKMSCRDGRGARVGGVIKKAPVPVWAAERIIAASQVGSSRRDLARTFKLSESTIKFEFSGAANRSRLFDRRRGRRR